MSFQDVGKRNSNRTNVASAGYQHGQQGRRSQGSSFNGMGMSGASGGSVAQISESLNQYQRNVGILEKIAQQLLVTSSNRANRTELEQQYKVQLDVLKQLEQRLKEQILTQRKMANESTKQTLVKLERDFDRVQAIAQSYKAKISRQQKEFQQRGADEPSSLEQNNAVDALQQEQARFQMQVQEDRLHEEIMREREQEIRNINKGMHTVNEIYKDLAHIVGGQQEQIDQIEGQMEDARTNAESGLSQVQKANEKYNNSNCIIS